MHTYVILIEKSKHKVPVVDQWGKNLAGCP